jgi:hypothetical protein
MQVREGSATAEQARHELSQRLQTIASSLGGQVKVTLQVIYTYDYMVIFMVICMGIYVVMYMVIYVVIPYGPKTGNSPNGLC